MEETDDKDPSNLNNDMFYTGTNEPVNQYFERIGRADEPSIKQKPSNITLREKMMIGVIACAVIVIIILIAVIAKGSFDDKDLIGNEN